MFCVSVSYDPDTEPKKMHEDPGEMLSSLATPNKLSAEVSTPMNDALPQPPPTTDARPHAEATKLATAQRRPVWSAQSETIRKAAKNLHPKWTRRFWVTLSWLRGGGGVMKHDPTP